MGFLKKLAGDAALYGISTIVGRLLNWMMMPIITRMFETPSMLAENAYFYAFMVPLNVIFTFGMETAFFRYASKAENQREYFNLILSFVLVLGLVLSGLIILFATPISELANYPGSQHLIIMLAVILWVDAISAVAFAKLRAQGKAKKFVAIRLSNIFLNIGVALFFVVFLQSILEGRYFPNLQSWAADLYSIPNGPDYLIWANYVASLLTLLLLYKELAGFRFTWSWEKLKPVVKYAYPLMLMGLAGSINLTADRLLFRSLLPDGFYPDYPNVEDAFSIYAQVYKLSIFMALVVQAYRYAAEPLFFSKNGDKNSPTLIALSTKWFTIACIVIWVGVSLNLNWIGLLIGKNFRSGIEVVPWLLLANLFLGLYNNVAIWFKLSDNTKYGTYITVGAMLLTVLLNILLIPQMGYMGCALAFTISTFLMVVACLILGQKKYPIPYEFKSVGLYMVLAGLIIWAHSQMNTPNLYVSIPIQLGICLAFIGFVFLRERNSFTRA